jgi:hypothetical protein
MTTIHARDHGVEDAASRLATRCFFARLSASLTCASTACVGAERRLSRTTAVEADATRELGSPRPHLPKLGTSAAQDKRGDREQDGEAR